MVARIFTVAFEGMEARRVEVQCALQAGLPGFAVVGLPDKAVSEARERVRAALSELGLALPSRRITVNLSPGDLPKEGSHYDLPIALALLAAMEAIPAEEAGQYWAMGGLALDGRLEAAPGALPAALAAGGDGRGLICPAPCGPEAAWVEAVEVIAPATLLDAVNHLSGKAVLAPARPGPAAAGAAVPDLSDVRGQEKARRALEIAAAGRHHLLMTGPPGAGKSMLAARLPGLLPPMTASEAMETAMIQSLAGLAGPDGGVSRARPVRAPHHTASVAAVVGGGRGAGPGELSLAHNGVLFLDELPEFPRTVLETLRQPLESGEVVVARANAHVRYPCQVLLVAAANPCRCGQMTDPARACARAPACGADYLGRLSGPLIDRIDLRLEVAPVRIAELAGTAPGEGSAAVAARVAAARAVQAARWGAARVNADADGDALRAGAAPSVEAAALLDRVAERFGLSARGWHRVLRVARTIADLDGAAEIARDHMAEAAAYRLTVEERRPRAVPRAAG